jgi:hypothetical protein
MQYMVDEDTQAEVDAAQGEATRLYEEMLDDLDTEFYGFGWWQGYMDQRRIALISEYLIASVIGVRDAISDAAFCFKEWTEQKYADDTWVRQTLKALGSGASDQDVLRALHRRGNNKKRETRIKLASEHVFYHLAQSLDRLAAVVIGVTALNTSILRADWSQVGSVAKFRKAQSDSKRQGQPPEGATLQADVRVKLLEIVEQAGPTDWLNWVDGMRNTHSHRAPKISMILTHRQSKKELPRLITLLERQPRWALTEELVGGKGESLEDVWLMRDPRGIHAGCVRSIALVMKEALTLLIDVWQRRKADPTLLLQPAGQWSKVLEEPLLAFDGYGEPIPTPAAGTIRVSPDTGRRMQASGIFDDTFWRSE